MQLFFSAQKQFDQLALGEETKSYFATSGKFPVHIQKLNSASLQALKMGWEVRGKKDCLLFLGNSQMHSVNQLKDSETTYLGILNDKTQGTDVLGVSFPNANLQEHWLAFAYLKQSLPIRYVALPVFMDDLREDGIRADGSFEVLKHENFALSAEVAINKKINQELQSTGNDAAGNANDLAALNQTVQEKTEKALNNFLDTFFNLKGLFHPSIKAAYKIINNHYAYSNTNPY